LTEQRREANSDTLSYSAEFNLFGVRMWPQYREANPLFFVPEPLRHIDGDSLRFPDVSAAAISSNYYLYCLPLRWSALFGCKRC
jgi:hypothetical protein